MALRDHVEGYDSDYIARQCSENLLIVTVKWRLLYTQKFKIGRETPSFVKCDHLFWKNIKIVFISIKIPDAR